MRARQLLAVLGLVLLLGTIGALSGPRWQPEPIQDRVPRDSLSTAIGSDAVTEPVGTYEVQHQDLEIELEGATVPARLTYPVGTTEPGPGMVFMHGAGTGRATSFTDQVTDLASAGVYSLVPAKNMDTYTTRDRDYVQMAADYVASVDHLRADPRVDPDRVGVYGESEGAYVAAVAAADYPQVAFTVAVSAPVVPAREQFAFAADSYLRHTGAPEPLLRAIPRAVGAGIPGGGFDYVDFDSSPYQQRITTPMLMVYGTDDIAMPVLQGASQMTQDFAVAGNDQLTIRYYADANHGIRNGGELVAGFTDDLARWTLGLPETGDAQPKVGGQEPEQTYMAAPVATPHWFASGDWMVYTLIGSIGVMIIGPVVWSGARLFQRRSLRVMPESLARFAAATALGALAALVFFVAYIAQVANYALNYQRNDVVVTGGYVVVLAVGVLAAGALFTSVERAWRSRGSGQWRRSGRLLWWTTHLGALSLLIIAAYWGVFPSFV